MESLVGDENDISVTKFLDASSDQMVTQRNNGDMNMTIIQFLDDNDISVTKFLEVVDSMNSYTQDAVYGAFLQ